MLVSEAHGYEVDGELPAKKKKSELWQKKERKGGIDTGIPSATSF